MDNIDGSSRKNFFKDIVLLAAAFSALYLGLAFMRPLASYFFIKNRTAQKKCAGAFPARFSVAIKN